MQKILENCAGYVIKRYATYRDKICVYDKHLIAGRDMQCRAPNSRSRYTAAFNDIIKQYSVNNTYNTQI